MRLEVWLRLTRVEGTVKINLNANIVIFIFPYKYSRGSGTIFCLQRTISAEKNFLP